MLFAVKIILKENERRCTEKVAASLAFIIRKVNTAFYRNGNENSIITPLS